MRTLHAHVSIVLSQRVQQDWQSAAKQHDTALPHLLLHQKGVKGVLVPQHLPLQKQICGNNDNTTAEMILLNDTACSD